MEINPGIIIEEICDRVDITFPTPKNSISKRRIRKDTRPNAPRINILEKKRTNYSNTKSQSRNSFCKGIIGYKYVQILVY